MNFLAMKFSSSSLFHDVEVCLSRIVWFLLHWLLMRMFNSRMRLGQYDRHHCWMIPITLVVTQICSVCRVIVWRITLNSAGLLFAAGLL